MKGFLNSRTFWIVICGIILFFSKISLGHNWPIKSYWEIRYKNVRGQNTLSSCGPASLATLFAEFYGMKTSEEEVIKLTKPYLEEEIEKLKEGDLPEGGVSMLDLKKVSRDLEIPAKGYEVPKRKVFSIMRKLATPLLIHLEKPENHFVLGVTDFRDQILLADPSWGIRSLGSKEFFNKWDGLVLAFSPPPEYRDKARKIINEVRQQARLRDRTQSLLRRFLWDH